MRASTFQVFVTAFATVALASCGGGGAAVPGAGTSATSNPANIGTLIPTPSPAPTSAPATAVHVNATANTPARTVDPTDAAPIKLQLSGAAFGAAGSAVTRVHLTEVMTGAPRPPQSHITFPDDLLYRGGFVLGSTVSHNVYVNAPTATTWGNPGLFLSDFGASNFISVLDQYIGFTNPNRYSKGTSYSISQSLFFGDGQNNPVLGQSDILGMAYTAANQGGGGYGNVYHIFLPPNFDTCFATTGHCYSPDNPKAFYFCGYHAVADFNSGQQQLHVLYTVEPYANVPGCAVINGPNGDPQTGNDTPDSQYWLLSHELSEVITDPDIDAWSNQAGYEIGDICEKYLYNVTLNGRAYAIQPEYSNALHGCTDGGTATSSLRRIPK